VGWASLHANLEQLGMCVSRAIRSFRHASRAPELWTCVRQSGDWGALIGGYLGLWPLRYPCEFRTRRGDILILENFHDLVTAWIIFFRREYEVDPSCRLIVDAGANIGAFSLFAAREAPAARVIALEPFPATQARLEAHLARNNLGARVTCRPWALGRADGPRRMDDSNGPSQSRGLCSDGATEEGVPVEAVTLATLWEREGLDQVDLLKIDIEGGEHEVFETTPPEVLRRAAVIALEYHPNGSKAVLFARLRDAGFTVLRDVPVPDGPDSGVAHFRRRT
jgi:FkbM family methyltransferase